MALAVDIAASSSAPSSAAARAGDIGGFSSGDFTVGGDKNMIWIFVVAGVVAVLFLVFRARK